MTSQTTNKEREQFESWYRINHPDPVHPDDAHANRVMRDNWFVVWVAAKGQPTSSSDKPTCDKADCLKRIDNLLAENEWLKRQVEVLRVGLDVIAHASECEDQNALAEDYLAAAKQIGKEYGYVSPYMSTHKKFEENIHQDRFIGFQAGRAYEADRVKSRMVIEKLVSALNNCQPAESAWLAEHFFAEESSDTRLNPILQDKWKAHDASSALREEALALAAQLLKGMERW